jgi:hypothetical protein
MADEATRIILEIPNDLLAQVIEHRFVRRLPSRTEAFRRLIKRGLVTSDDFLIAALVAIARGRTDNGRPMGGEDARQLARRALNEGSISWGVSPGGGSHLLDGHSPVSPNA